MWITVNNKSQQVFLPFDSDIFVYFRIWLKLIEECIWNVLTVEDWCFTYTISGSLKGVAEYDTFWG